MKKILLGSLTGLVGLFGIIWFLPSGAHEEVGEKSATRLGDKLEESEMSAKLERKMRSLGAKVSRLEQDVNERRRAETETAAEGATQNDEGEATEEADDPAMEKRRIKRDFELVSAEFVTEPIEPEARVEQEQLAETVAAALPGFEPQVECRSTLCRIEIQKGAPDEDFDLGALYDAGGFRDGGMAHTLEDGRVVLFAAREGYPFQQLHAHK